MQPQQAPFKSFMESLVGPPPKWYQRIDWENLIERLMLALTTVTVVYLSPQYGALLAMVVVIMVGAVKIAEMAAGAYTGTHQQNGGPDNE